MIAHFGRIGRLHDLIQELGYLRPLANWERKPEPIDLPLDNPFTYGPVITDPNHFYGRSELIDSFFSAMYHDPPTSTYVIGARRSGKTSFLRDARHPDILRKRLRDRAATTIIIYVDLQQIAGQADLFAVLLREADQAFADQHRVHSPLARHENRSEFR